MGEFALVPVAFASSCLAGAIGMGGGVLLLAVMPGLLPTSAILPVHACTQLMSNASRAFFGWREIDWRMLPALLAGAALGAWLGAGLYQSVNLRWLPALIGVLIILLTWLPAPKPRGSGNVALFLLGCYQTGLGMVAGATGPLGAAVLLRRNDNKDWLVVNTAVYMTINHCLRVCAFAMLGFAFSAWLVLILALSVAVIAGSWLGTRLRRFVPQGDFERWFRWLVTLLALRMVLLSLMTAH